MHACVHACAPACVCFHESVGVPAYGGQGTPLAVTCQCLILWDKVFYSSRLCLLALGWHEHAQLSLVVLGSNSQQAAPHWHWCDGTSVIWYWLDVKLDRAFPKVLIRLPSRSLCNFSIEFSSRMEVEDELMPFWYSDHCACRDGHLYLWLAGLHMSLSVLHSGIRVFRFSPFTDKMRLRDMTVLLRGQSWG